MSVMWSPGMRLEDLERQAILHAYKFYQFNKTVTANSLGIAIRTLDAKLAKYDEDDVKNKKAAEERRRQREEFLMRERGMPAGSLYDTSASPNSGPKPGEITVSLPSSETAGDVTDTPRTVAPKKKA